MCDGLSTFWCICVHCASLFMFCVCVSNYHHILHCVGSIQCRTQCLGTARKYRPWPPHMAAVTTLQTPTLSSIWEKKIILMSGLTHTHEKSNVTLFDQSVTIELSNLWVCDMMMWVNWFLVKKCRLRPFNGSWGSSFVIVEGVKTALTLLTLHFITNINFETTEPLSALYCSNIYS